MNSAVSLGKKKSFCDKNKKIHVAAPPKSKWFSGIECEKRLSHPRGSLLMKVRWQLTKMPHLPTDHGGNFKTTSSPHSTQSNSVRSPLPQLNRTNQQHSFVRINVEREIQKWRHLTIHSTIKVQPPVPSTTATILRQITTTRTNFPV